MIQLSREYVLEKQIREYNRRMAMKGKILKLFFGALFTALVFLLGAITGANIAFHYVTLLIMVIVAIVSATIGTVCTSPAKPKKEKKTKNTKKEDPKDVYSYTK